MKQFISILIFLFFSQFVFAQLLTLSSNKQIYSFQIGDTTISRSSCSDLVSNLNTNYYEMRVVTKIDSISANKTRVISSISGYVIDDLLPDTLFISPFTDSTNYLTDNLIPDSVQGIMPCSGYSAKHQLNGICLADYYCKDTAYYFSKNGKLLKHSQISAIDTSQISQFYGWAKRITIFIDSIGTYSWTNQNFDQGAGIVTDNQSYSLVYFRSGNKVIGTPFTFPTNVETVNKLEPKNAWVKVFPNPSTDFIIIGSESFIKDVQITNYSGVVLYNHCFTNEISKLNIPINNLNIGMYLIKIKTTKGCFVRSVTKQ